MKNIDYQLEILQAAKDGKDIEVRLKDDKKWRGLFYKYGDGYDFDFYTNDYRVKPEPKTLYRVEVVSLGEWSRWSDSFSEAEADVFAENASAYFETDQVRIRKFVEVPNDED